MYFPRGASAFQGERSVARERKENVRTFSFLSNKILNLTKKPSFNKKKKKGKTATALLNTFLVRFLFLLISLWHFQLIFLHAKVFFFFLFLFYYFFIYAVAGSWVFVLLWPVSLFFWVHLYVFLLLFELGFHRF